MYLTQTHTYLPYTYILDISHTYSTYSTYLTHLSVWPLTPASLGSALNGALHRSVPCHTKRSVTRAPQPTDSAQDGAQSGALLASRHQPSAPNPGRNQGKSRGFCHGFCVWIFDGWVFSHKLPQMFHDFPHSDVK